MKFEKIQKSTSISLYKGLKYLHAYHILLTKSNILNISIFFMNASSEWLTNAESDCISNPFSALPYCHAFY